jgi:vanillate O-demethylase ferredoxin subunit
VHLNFDHEPGGRPLDMAELQARYAAGTHFYCCGPVGMLQAFEKATEPRPRESVHVEYFASTKDAATDGGYTVQLARRGMSLPVMPGKSILNTLMDAGLDVNYSCMDGICGSCEVRVLSGEPDHRDLVLSPQEQALNQRMMICCSGSRSATLVLDL